LPVLQSPIWEEHDPVNEFFRARAVRQSMLFRAVMAPSETLHLSEKLLGVLYSTQPFCSRETPVIVVYLVI
jgi:hypothetical protein